MNSSLDYLRKDECLGKRIHGKSRDYKYEEFESRGNRKHVLNMHKKICMTKLCCTGDRAESVPDKALYEPEDSRNIEEASYP